MVAESGGCPPDGAPELLTGCGGVNGCIGFCGAVATVFTAGFVSSVSQKSQIAIAATIKMMTTISGQFSLLNENADAVCGAAFVGVVAAGAGVVSLLCVDGATVVPPV